MGGGQSLFYASQLRLTVNRDSPPPFYFTICLYISSISIVPPPPDFSLQPAGPLFTLIAGSVSISTIVPVEVWIKPLVFLPTATPTVVGIPLPRSVERNTVSDVPLPVSPTTDL